MDLDQSRDPRNNAIAFNEQISAFVRRKEAVQWDEELSTELSAQPGNCLDRVVDPRHKATFPSGFLIDQLDEPGRRTVFIDMLNRLFEVFQVKVVTPLRHGLFQLEYREAGNDIDAFRSRDQIGFMQHIDIKLFQVNRGTLTHGFPLLPECFSAAQSGAE